MTNVMVRLFSGLAVGACMLATTTDLARAHSSCQTSANAGNNPQKDFVDHADTGLKGRVLLRVSNGGYAKLNVTAVNGTYRTRLVAACSTGGLDLELRDKTLADEPNGDVGASRTRSGDISFLCPNGGNGVKVQGFLDDRSNTYEGGSQFDGNKSGCPTTSS
jgi:hypothetical protein